MKTHILVIITTLLLTIQPFPTFSQQKSTSTPAQSADLVEAEELNAQVIALYNARKYDKALPLAKRVLMLREKAVGPDHVLVVDALANVAELLFIRGLRGEALKTYRRYLNTYDRNRVSILLAREVK